MIEQDRGDQTGRDRGEDVVAARRLHPVVSGRRRVQMVRTPVVDDVVAPAVLARDVAAAIPVVVGAGSASVPVAIRVLDRSVSALAVVPALVVARVVAVVLARIAVV